MSKEQPFKCLVPGCTNYTSRLPKVCTEHFFEGWGRLEEMPLPLSDEVIRTAQKHLDNAPLYVSDKDKRK